MTDETDHYESERTDWERDTVGIVCCVDDQTALQVQHRQNAEAWVSSTVPVFDLRDMV